MSVNQRLFKYVRLRATIGTLYLCPHNRDIRISESPVQGVTLYHFITHPYFVPSIFQIMYAMTEEQGMDCLKDDCSFLLECGFTSRLSLENHSFLLQAVWKHCTHNSILAELVQLHNGLHSVLNFSYLTSNHPAKVLKILTKSSTQINANTLLDLFDVSYSEGDHVFYTSVVWQYIVLLW